MFSTEYQRSICMFYLSLLCYLGIVLSIAIDKPDHCRDRGLCRVCDSVFLHVRAHRFLLQHLMNVCGLKIRVYLFLCVGHVVQSPEVQYYRRIWLWFSCPYCELSMFVSHVVLDWSCTCAQSIEMFTRTLDSHTLKVFMLIAWLVIFRLVCSSYFIQILWGFFHLGVNYSILYHLKSIFYI